MSLISAFFSCGRWKLVMKLVGKSSITPGGAMTKKLTRIESQSSLRRLVTRASTRLPATSKVEPVVELEAQRLGQPLLHRELRLAARPQP